MNIENIKVGETYNIRVKAVKIHSDGISVKTIDEKDNLCLDCCTGFASCEAAAFSPIISANGIKNIETTPKYDSCRLFREGDEVRYVPYNGRECPAMPCDEYYREKTLTVVKDEDSNHQVLVRTQDGREKYIRFCYLKLVTPVEELEPYYVSTNIDCSTCTIFKRVGEKKLVHSAYYFVHGKGCKNAIMGITEAKAAAEAECVRLNTEYRKDNEQ